MRFTIFGGGQPLADAIRTIITAREGPGPVTPAVAQSDPSAITVIANTLADITVHGLRMCPEIDRAFWAAATVPAGAGSAAVQQELEAFDIDGSWLTLSDSRIAAGLIRTRLLGLGYSLSQVTAAMADRWKPAARILPLTDDPVELHAVGGEQPVAHHVREWLEGVPLPPVERVVATGMDKAEPSPAVLDAIRGADVVVLASTEPACDVGPAIAMPGVRDALAATRVVAADVAGSLDDRFALGSLVGDLVDEWLDDGESDSLAAVVAGPSSTDRNDS